MMPIAAMRLRKVAASGSGFTVSLLHFDGTNGGTTFTDESGKIWTLTGSVTTSTVKKVFGTASGLFAGGRIDCIPGGSDFDFGTGDFTVEFFVQPTLNNTAGVYLDNRFGSFGTGIAVSTPNGSSSPAFTIAGTSLGGLAYTTGVWYHLAISRASGVTRCFQGGTQLGSNIPDTGAYTGSQFRLGQAFNGGSGFSGNIDEFRITKGLGRYTSNFTPPAAPFPYP